MISPEQKIERRKYLGASEIAAVIGLDQHRSAADVWLTKTGEADDFEGNEATRRGELLEPAILKYAGQEIGKPFDVDTMLIHPNGIHAANFDGIAPDRDFVVEAKSSRVNGEYGEPMTDQVPDKVIIQTHAQMLVAGPQCRMAYVPIISAGLDFKLYIVPRDEEICRIVLNTGVDFMEKFVRPKIRPSDFRPSIEVLKRVRRQPKSFVDIKSELIDRWEEAKAARKEAEEYAESQYAALLAALRGAEAAFDETGRMVSFFEQHRKGYTVKATSFRVMRLQTNAKRI
jgi:putative phage-type endonuclease